MLYTVAKTCALVTVISAAPIPADHGRELAGWADYAKQGVATGLAYANAGVSGEGSFSDLNAQTADAFNALNHDGETTASSPMPSLDTAVVNEPLPASLDPATVSWKDYMQQGIETGIEFAAAGAGVATGETDPSSDFGDLVAQTADDFGALNHARDVVAEPASGEDIDPGFSIARPPLSPSPTPSDDARPYLSIKSAGRGGLQTPCSGCLGDTSGVCQNEGNQVCYDLVQGHCPAGTKPCEASPLMPVPPPPPMEQCTGCWGFTKGVCQGADTVCYPLVRGHACPPGTFPCGSLPPLDPNKDDDKATIEDLANYQEAFRAEMASAAAAANAINAAGNTKKSCV